MIDDTHDCLARVLPRNNIHELCCRSGTAKRWQQPQSIVAADRVEFFRAEAERVQSVHSVADWKVWVVAAEHDLRNRNESSECSNCWSKGRSCDVVVEAHQLMFHAVRCVCREVRRTVV